MWTGSVWEERGPGRHARLVVGHQALPFTDHPALSFRTGNNPVDGFFHLLHPYPALDARAVRMAASLTMLARSAPVKPASAGPALPDHCHQGLPARVLRWPPAHHVGLIDDHLPVKRPAQQAGSKHGRLVAARMTPSLAPKPSISPGVVRVCSLSS